MENIENYLHEGKVNAVKSSDLEKLLGVDHRTLLKAISRERLQGALICACKDGYYLPADDNEVIHYVTRAEKRALQEMKTVYAMQKRIEQREVADNGKANS